MISVLIEELGPKRRATPRGLSVHNVSILHGVFTRVDAGVPMFGS